MNPLTNDITQIIQQDFEAELPVILSQMPHTPAGATPEQIIRHVGPIFHRLAFMKGMSVGVEASKVYMR